MYMPNPRDVIRVLDGASRDLLWEHRRTFSEEVDEFLITTSPRSTAISPSTTISSSTPASVDDCVFVGDAETGRLAWETQILDYPTHSANQTSGPIIAGGKVISGRNCTPEGGPEACVITAHDVRTGEGAVADTHHSRARRNW